MEITNRNTFSRNALYERNIGVVVMDGLTAKIEDDFLRLGGFLQPADGQIDAAVVFWLAFFSVIGYSMEIWQ